MLLNLRPTKGTFSDETPFRLLLRWSLLIGLGLRSGLLVHRLRLRTIGLVRLTLQISVHIFNKGASAVRTLNLLTRQGPSVVTVDHHAEVLFALVAMKALSYKSVLLFLHYLLFRVFNLFLK